ncbi:uncharacterized protein YdhG (YjbR/CyaY superfamily) [Sphaerotilus hippei]|uniref:Uncharacterized protein YdhG (YjbR/CyaY superfamily) n=1 Tax=Sphaerotilus hippei TaxID=744406 RepID=A0A318GWB3_9BURK|nr:DUF1801 domain-containing protein [Sphaerotilus hippei]PXW93697.1 uncharacterized protein YdhG (YjbR/CyaY superfamily) [Sphaerotilus hippei]
MRHLIRPAALVATYFDTLQPVQEPTARAVSRTIMAAVPELEQAVKWGNLTFQLAGRNVLALVMHKGHAHLQVFNGVLLTERFPQLEGAGKGLRHVKLRYSMPLDIELVEDLALAAVAAGLVRED